MDRPVIVTGAAGFAGSHLLERLAETLPRDTSLVAWRRPGGTEPRRSPVRVTWEAVDLLDCDAVAAAMGRTGPSTVYHCSGSPHVAGAWLDTLRPLESNVRATHHLLRAVERGAPDAAVFVPSSALVYRPSDGPLSEESAIAPRTPYGVSKLAQELLARHAQARAFIARPFNHIGAGQAASFVSSGFARQLAEIEAGLREPTIQVGNLDARRDLTDVRDTVRAYQTIVERGVPGRVYNVCSGRACRMGDLLDLLMRLSTVRAAVAVDPDRLRPADVPVLLGDPSRSAAELGWRAEIPLEQTLSELLDYWRAQLRARAGDA